MEVTSTTLFEEDSSSKGREMSGWQDGGVVCARQGRGMDRVILKQAGDKEWRCSRGLSFDSMESWSMLAREAKARYQHTERWA